MKANRQFRSIWGILTVFLASLSIISLLRRILEFGVAAPFKGVFDYYRLITVEIKSSAEFILSIFFDINITFSNWVVDALVVHIFFYAANLRYLKAFAQIHNKILSDKIEDGSRRQMNFTFLRYFFSIAGLRDLLFPYLAAIRHLSINGPYQFLKSIPTLFKPEVRSEMNSHGLIGWWYGIQDLWEFSMHATSAFFYPLLVAVIFLAWNAVLLS